MSEQRTVALGHAAVLAFATVLLAAAQKFLVLHPLIAALLLAAFAPAYLIAARMNGKRQFLYPFLILLIISYNLFLFGAGFPFKYLTIFSTVPLFAVYFAAKKKIFGAIDGSETTAFAVNALLIAVFTLAILFRPISLFHDVPDIITITFLVYSAYWTLRFRDTEKPLALLWSVIFAFAGYVFLLHHRGAFALLLTALLIAKLSVDLYLRPAKRRIPEALLCAILIAVLIEQAFFGSKAWLIMLGYAGMGLVTLQLATYFHRSGRMRYLYPVFMAGILMMLVPIYFLYPYKDIVLTFFYLLILFAGFTAGAARLRESARTFLGISTSRVLGVLGRVFFVLAFLDIAWARFPGSYFLSATSILFAFVAAVAAYRTPPAILKNRSVYLYVTGLFLMTGYILFIRRLGLAGLPGAILSSSFIPITALLSAGFRLRDRLNRPQYLTLMESGIIFAVGAAIYHALLSPSDLILGFAVAAILIAISVALFRKTREISILHIATAATGLLLYEVSLKSGIRGDWLGMPFLVSGFIAAAAGIVFEKRGRAGSDVCYFAMFLYLPVSLVLFYPFLHAGAYVAPLWVLPLLIVAKQRDSRKRFVFSLITESLGHVLAFAAIVYLLIQGLYLPGSFVLLIYAAVYAHLSRITQHHWYAYPASLLLTGAYFLLILSLGAWRLYILHSIPLALAFAAFLVFLDRKKLRAWMRPVHVAATANAVLAALLLVLAPAGAAVFYGIACGLFYLFLYISLVKLTKERAYLAGVSLSASFIVYHLLWGMPFTTTYNHLALFAPAGLIVAWIGRMLKDHRSRWALYAAATTLALITGVFALSPDLTSSGMSRIVLFVSMSVWLLLLLWVRSEIFIYLASLTLAALSYNFLQSTTDRFGQHMFVFFLYGVALLGLVFVARVGRNLVRYRRPVLLVEGKKWSERFLYATPVIVIVLATLGAFTVESTSNPQFCGMCHTMNRYYANWQMSVHGKTEVACASCHYEPGLRGYAKAKVRGFSELVTEVTATGSYRPQAEVHDASCLRGGCHDIERLAGVKNQRFNFDHSIHMGMEIEGIELHCTSCHSKVDTKTHFAVDTQACFSCHFATQEVAARNCTACHDVPKQAVGERHFLHSGVVAASDDAQCLMCHASTVQQASLVASGRCSDCHLEPPASLMNRDPVALHRKHVTEKNIKCGSCHDSLRHGVKQHPPVQTAECSGCHGDSHSAPSLLYVGAGGIGVKSMPSPMYLSGVECSACHQQGIMIAAGALAACEKCHGTEIGSRVQQYRVELDRSIADVEAHQARVVIFASMLPENQRVQFYELLGNSQKNVDLVKKGKAIHNYEFAKELLLKSEDFLSQAQALATVRTVERTSRNGVSVAKAGASSGSSGVNRK